MLLKLNNKNFHSSAMKFKLHIKYIVMSTLALLCISCSTKKVDATAIINNETRINYYKPFFESAPFASKIYALTNMTAMHKAAANFSVNSFFIVDAENDSLYKLKQGIKSFNLKNKGNARLLRSNLVPAKQEDINVFKKLQSFLNDAESTKLVHSSGNNTKGNLIIYMLYTIDIDNKIKEESLPMNFTDIKELNIVDISVDEK